MFAWSKFLEQQGIPTRDGGKYEILVRCPFCGQSDPSQHLSISLRGRGWRCLRSKAHKGSSYARLLANLIGCTEEHARDVLGEQVTSLPAQDQFGSIWRRQLGVEPQPVEHPRHIKFPRETKPLLKAGGKLAGLFWQHLQNRGYDHSEADWLAKTYRLQYAVAGWWSYRLIIPVYDAAGELMTWVGRSIVDDQKRYLNLPAAQSVESAPNLLLGLDFLWRVLRARCLVITEGPFDAMAVTVLGYHDGIWGTCLFGVQVSAKQAVLLNDLSRKFDCMRLLVDPDARMKVLSLRDRLPRNCEVRELSAGIKDPGELPLKEHAIEHVRGLI